jgi:hypothetical protein
MTTRLQRAEWLGSAGVTALVRCACGARLYVERRQWAGRGFTVCDGCGAVILYASLDVVDPEGVEEFVAMSIRQGQEREAIMKELERELRRFVGVYDGQPEWLWSPATQRLVRAVRPKLERLGGPVWPGRARDVATPEGAYRGEQ